MKKTIIGVFAACGLLFSVAGGVQAQTTARFGIKAGGSLNFSRVTAGKASYGGDSRLGFFGGGLIELSPGTPQNKFKIQLEALYSRENLALSLPGNDREQLLIDVDQINFPLLAKYFILPELSINLGPTFNFNLNASGIIKDTLGSAVDLGKMEKMETFQAGLAVGATFYIYRGLFVDARYTPLFGALNAEERAKYKSNAIKLGIGYKF